MEYTAAMSERAPQRSLPNATAPGIALQHSLAGQHVSGVGGENHAHGNIQPAGLHSTAPYKRPPRRAKDNPDLILCAFDGCKGFPIKTTEFCSGHSRSMKIGPWAPTETKDSDDDTGSTAAVGSTADGDDAG